MYNYNTITIYRWEHIEHGCGPYNCFTKRGSCFIDKSEAIKFKLEFTTCLFEHHDNKHPSLGFEIERNNVHIPEKFYNVSGIDNVLEIYKPASDMKFGFESIEQMKSWFNIDEINLMTHFGFGLFEIKLIEDDVCFLTKQCIFDSTKILYKKQILNYENF